MFIYLIVTTSYITSQGCYITAVKLHTYNNHCTAVM